MKKDIKLNANKSKEQKDEINNYTKPKNLVQTLDTPINRILHLQRTIGNQAIQKLLKSGNFQTKLKISAMPDADLNGTKISAKLLQAPPNQPSRPAIPQPVHKEFSTLSKKIKLSDPTKRSHGIKIEVNGDDLYYYLKGDKSPRLVPRPQASDGEKNRPIIKTISWAHSPDLAFSAAFGYPNEALFYMGRFSVDLTGKAIYERTTRTGTPKQKIEYFKEGFAKARTPSAFPLSIANDTRYTGAIRYFYPKSSFSLFQMKSANQIEIIDNATGKRLDYWPKTINLSLQSPHLMTKPVIAKVLAFSITSGGQTTIVWQEKSGVPRKVVFSLKSKNYSAKTNAHKISNSKLNSLYASLKAKKVEIKEQGASFTEKELKTILEMIKGWKSKVLPADALGISNVTITMDSSFDKTTAATATKYGIILIPASPNATPDDRLSTLVHEFTHVLFAASGFDKKTKPPGSKANEYADALKAASVSGTIDEGEITNTQKRTKQQWKEALSTDAELNRIWSNLHFRFSIDDPEFSGDIRGIDVADESRYSNATVSDSAGHGFDNVSEFIASYISSTRRYQLQMVSTIKASQSRRLAGLYRDLWNWADKKFFVLSGTNPYAGLANTLTK